MNVLQGRIDQIHHTANSLRTTRPAPTRSQPRRRPPFLLVSDLPAANFALVYDLAHDLWEANRGSIESYAVPVFPNLPHGEKADHAYALAPPTSCILPGTPIL